MSFANISIWTSACFSDLQVMPPELDSITTDVTSLFILQQGFEVAYLLIYVDDIILTTSSIALLQQTIASLHNEFDMTDLGRLIILLVFLRFVILQGCSYLSGSMLFNFLSVHTWSIATLQDSSLYKI